MSHNYKRGACIGRGSFGQVYKAVEINSGQVVALKLQDLEKSADEIDVIRREIQVMSEISSPHVVRYYASFIENTTLWLVMEYMAGGSLKDILDVVGPFSEDAVATVLKALCKGLEYIHREQKLHRDIKAANILLTAGADVKLADFGVAGQMTHTLRARHTYVGSPFWMAPEVIARSQYDQTADIWSLGITAIELLRGSPPYADKHFFIALECIPRNDPPRLDASFSKSARDFVAACLARSPNDRASAAALVGHPFLRKAKPSALKELLRRKVALTSQQSGDSLGAPGSADISTEDITAVDGSNTIAWEFDSGTDSNAGTVRVRHEEEIPLPYERMGTVVEVPTADSTIVKPPQPPAPKEEHVEKPKPLVPIPVVPIPKESSGGILADLCLPVLASLRAQAVEGGRNEANLARALGQLEIAFVHGEEAKPGLCEMFFRELITAALTSESREIRDLVIATMPKKFVKSKSTRR